MILAIQLALTVVTTPYAAKVFPLRPATIEGKVQCFSPNVARRTCQTIVQYRALTNVAFINTATVLINSQPGMTMRVSTTSRVVNDAVCGTMMPGNLADATLYRDGAVVPRDVARPILAKVATEMAPLMGRETCTRFAATATGFVAKVSIKGRLPTRHGSARPLGRPQ